MRKRPKISVVDKAKAIYLQAARQRNAEIVRRVRAGEPMVALAREYGITAGRISQIVTAAAK